ncbi:uncharacterized protein LOC111331393 [Stylophora pistillata]|uniref:uncharacterized protein LOC111331393 n=1 Tax=Stylophora pistillata TaxID=50429 RepID=UPI000C056C6C|nr:uncharacterized protein LOC111331393 [Stylophora pistillata]
MQLSAFVVPLICDSLQSQSIVHASVSHAHLRELELADYSTGEDDIMVDILVGSDWYWKLVSRKVLRGEDGPTAIQTRIGWVLSGPTNGAMQNDQQQNNFVTTHVLKTATKPVDITNESLDGTLQRFWDLESLGVRSRSVYEEFEERITFENDRYVVHLPWKLPHPILPDNYELSIKRLIIRRDKATTKLRVVYDASARFNGVAQNDYLYTRPPLAENIFDILLRFRAGRIALTGDVEKAFLIVGIAEEDRDVLRFLWVDDIEKKNPEIVVLRFTRVVFGVCSSPFPLNATLKHHIERYKNEDPEFVDQFLCSIYVDDLSSGTADNNAAYELYLKCKLRLAEGGFNLRKFMSNSSQLTERIQQNEARISAPAISANTDHMKSPSDLSKEDSVIEEDKTYAKSMVGTTKETSGAEQKVLSARWNFVSDHFVLDLGEIVTPARNIEPTERNVVSVTVKFYDPIGFLSLIITEFKIFFQEGCKAKIGWDEPLEGELKNEWLKLAAGLQYVSSFTVLRCYFQEVTEKIVSCSLYGFGDASSKAYAAVIYLHVTTATGSYVKFLASRSRVAPVKQETIPRLKFLAALILARLISHVGEALKPELYIINLSCWTDSKVALAWIKGERREWKPFVQNRVNEIRTFVPVNSWRHCRGRNNPTDIPPRGLSPSELLVCALWIEVPTWLSGNAETGSEEFDTGQLPQECLEEMKARDKEEWKSETSSSLLVVAETISIANIEELTSQDIAVAEKLWIKEIQKSLSKNSKFEIWKRQFGIFTDEHGIMRCTGRLSQAQLPASAKYPILLDKSHYITSLFVRDSHKRVMHGVVKSTLTELRARFWIVQGRQFVRKLLYECVVCRRLEGGPCVAPPPPPLPEFRVKEEPPFTYVGIDFVGPLYVKSLNSPQQKVWICLYTCCVTRAIHLDLVPDLTTNAFLRSFRRFTARRGRLSLVVTDNGRTFKPAAREITRIFNDPGVKQHLAKEHRKWTFNLEKAPWWGGVFERLVKSVKRCLKKTISGARLTYEELSTHSSNRVVSIGDVVSVHDEDQPRGKWRIGKVEALVTGSEGRVGGAVVRVKTKAGRLTKLRRPVQRLYPLEVRCRNEEPETTISPGRAEPDLAVRSMRPEQHPELRLDRPRRVAATGADRRRKAWIENLN